MFRKLVLTVALCGAISTPVSTHAQELIESYTALLSEADHFNSSGQRLTSAAAIIRQDRANYYRYGVRDTALVAARGSRALRARALVIIEEFRTTLFHENLPPMRANPAAGSLSREGRRPRADLPGGRSRGRGLL